MDLEAFRQQLLEQREALLAQDAISEVDRAPVTLDQDSVGRLSRIDAMQVQSMALAQQRRRQAERAAIDAAFERMDEGEFGFCLTCGEAIPEARLKHNPAAATCILCAKPG